MGNTSQCGFMTQSDQQFQYLGDENHFLYGPIKHFKTQKLQNQHFALKKLKFPTQNRLKQFKNFIQLYHSFCSPIMLIKANQYLNPNLKSKTPQGQHPGSQKQNQNSNSMFHCNKENFLFVSTSQQLSCSEPSYSLILNLEYLSAKSSLQSLLNQKAETLQKSTQNNKVNQNVLLELQNKVKLCQYQKIDRLPPKQRSIINFFFSQIEVLRMLDCMITSLYGLKLNGIDVSAVRPQFFFKPSEKDEILYFYPGLIQSQNMSNYQRSYQNLKRWLNEQNGKFHHNWSIKQKQLISYLHPENLQKLTEDLLSEGSQSNFGLIRSSSKKQVQKHNIFALGLMVLELCLLEPYICAKIYKVTTCRKEQKPNATTKKEMKYIFHKENLSIKMNNSVLQKYLIQLKTRYSESFLEIVQTMIFGVPLCHKQKTEKSQRNINPTYEDVIQHLQVLIYQNVLNIKQVYNYSNKSKSKSKHCSQKNSRNPSLPRQVSSSGISNQSLSSSSSLSMLPVQTQQKILSIELLKKNCKQLQTQLDKVLIKSQVQTMKGSFAERGQRLEQLISNDEQRILSQLNQLNIENPLPKKKTRFNHRRIQQNQSNNLKTQESSFLKNIHSTVPNEEYVDFKLHLPSNLSTKNQGQEKQKRVNSTTKTKKILLQKARQQQSLGNSVCHTIYLNKSKDMSHVEESHININSETDHKMDKNANVTDKEVLGFEQNGIQQFSSKSQLKNLIALKDRRTTIKQHSNMHLSCEQHRFKELNSRQLYEIYMKEYKNLISSHKTVQKN